MKYKMAMIGGGAGSFIGPVHLMAARLDGMIELVAGAFSSDAENSVRSGLEYGLDKKRIYTGWQEMIEKESEMPEGQRPDFICIVTPNYLHFKPALESLKAGFNVVCDKPLCMTVQEAYELSDAIKQ